MAVAHRGAMARLAVGAKVAAVDAHRGTAVVVHALKGAARDPVVLNAPMGVLGIAVKRLHLCQSSMWLWCPMTRVWIPWLARFG